MVQISEIPLKCFSTDKSSTRTTFLQMTKMSGIYNPSRTTRTHSTCLAGLAVGFGKLKPPPLPRPHCSPHTEQHLPSESSFFYISSVVLSPLDPYLGNDTIIIFRNARWTKATLDEEHNSCQSGIGGAAGSFWVKAEADDVWE